MKALVILSLALFAGAATAEAPGDIVHTAEAAGSFQTLAKAIAAAGLTGALEGKGPYTVFAPTDAAFAKLPPGTVEGLLEPQNRAKLRAILLYHVVAGRLDSTQVEHLSSMKTLEGQRLRVAMGSQGPVVDGAEIVQADIPAENGIIHAIDTVLIPPAK